MSWSVLQSCSRAVGADGTVSAVSTTFTTANLSSGSKLIAYTNSTSSTAFATVKDGSGNSFTQVGSTVTNGFEVMQIWVLDTPSGDVGTKPTITATLSSSSAQLGILVQEVSGLVTGTSCLDGTQGSVTGTGGTSTGSPSYSSTAANEYLVSFYNDDGGGGGSTLTQPSGYTLDSNSVNSNNPGDIGVAYTNSSNGTESGGWTRTNTGAQWGVILVAFQVAASAAPNTTDIPSVQPGPTWFDLFKPWIQRPRPPAAEQPGNQPPPPPPDQLMIQPGPTWLDLFKPGMPRPRPPAPQPGWPVISATGSFTLAPLAFTAQAGETSPDQPATQPGPTWLDLFKPWLWRPRPPAPQPGWPAVTSSGSLSLAPLALSGQGSQTSPDQPVIQPGFMWLDLFKQGLRKPRPFTPAQPTAAGVTSTGSFTLAPLAFTGQGGQSSPDITQTSPGPLWLRFFKPWAQRPVPPPPAVQSVTSSGSFSLAPLALSGAGAQTSPDQPSAQPGPSWLRLFRPWLQRPVPPPPAFQSVNATGSLSLAPLAFSATAGQSSPDLPQAQPGPFWTRLFRPQAPKPFPPPPAFQVVSASGSFSLAPLALSGQGAQTSPDLPQIAPGPSWLRLLRPWVQRPVPPVPAVQAVTSSGSLALAPLAFSGSSAPPLRDFPQVTPGPAWFRFFKPWVQRPVPPVPPAWLPPPATSSGSLSLAPLAFTAQGGQTSPDLPQAEPGPSWLRLFRPWIRRPFPPVPSVQAVTSSGSLALAPIAFSAQGAQSSPDQPQASPGPSWLRFFKPWQWRPYPPVPATPAVTASGSFSLAPIALSGTGTVTGAVSADQPQVQPGPLWLRLFKPGLPRPVPVVPAQPSAALPSGPAPDFTFGTPYTSWATGEPYTSWTSGQPYT